MASFILSVVDVSKQMLHKPVPDWPKTTHLTPQHNNTYLVKDLRVYFSHARQICALKCSHTKF